MSFREFQYLQILNISVSLLRKISHCLEIKLKFEKQDAISKVIVLHLILLLSKRNNTDINRTDMICSVTGVSWLCK